ncbi:hypothetical protein PVAP13_1NG427319 [Panicum virgatum]|uniref:Uncharacterized protein n=1 Tax=Panicum virgatum TaxID=38727 RepID=A0A8T0X5I2_PANVG|nr:hypothetical protein PVAP13_1NG427319 [Panicum virgatum]
MDFRMAPWPPAISRTAAAIFSARTSLKFTRTIALPGPAHASAAAHGAALPAAPTTAVTRRRRSATVCCCCLRGECWLGSTPICNAKLEAAGSTDRGGLCHGPRLHFGARKLKRNLRDPNWVLLHR